MKRFLGFMCLWMLFLSAVAISQEGPFVVAYDKWKDQTTVVPNYKNLIPNISIGGPPVVTVFATFKGTKTSADTLIKASLQLQFVFHTRGFMESYSSAQDTVFFVDGKRVELTKYGFERNTIQLTPGIENPEWVEVFSISVSKELIESFVNAKGIESRFRIITKEVKEYRYAEFLLTQEETKYLKAFLDLLNVSY